MTTMRLMTDIAYDWGVRCFGDAHMSDRKIRAIRMLEEAVEACQAVCVSSDDAQAVIDGVYARPVGAIEQELGGVLVTASVLARAIGRYSEELFELELRRCLSKTPESFAERNRQKLWGDR